MSHTGSWAPKLIHLASDRAQLNRDTTKNSSATFTLARPIHVPADYQMYIYCVNAIIPYSFWSIPTAVSIPILYGAGNTPLTLTVPAGNYSAPALATILTTSGAPAGLTVSYDVNLGVFTFQTGGTHAVTFLAQPQNLYIGIPAAGISIAISTLYTAPLAPSIIGTKCICLNTDIPISTISAGTGTAQTLCFIPVDVNPYSLIVYKPGQGIPVKQIVSTNYISSITITLTDEAGNPIDFKGLHWSCDLCFELLTPPDMQDKSFTEIVEGGSLFDASKRTPAQSKAYLAL